MWLYSNELDGADSVRKFVAFYFEQHNPAVPHFAFQGQTPDEMVFGIGANVPVDLQEKRVKARAAMLAHSRAMSCERCTVPLLSSKLCSSFHFPNSTF
jgi:putative transposase